MRPDLFSPVFDYAIVDGLGRAAQRERVPQLAGQIFRASAAGPIVEFVQLESASELATLRASDWFDDGSLGPMLAPLAERPLQWLAQDGRQGLISATGLEREDILTSFKIDAHKAALAAGFSGTAALLVAAMGELIGNVVDHSEALASGTALFSAQSGQFEVSAVLSPPCRGRRLGQSRRRGRRHAYERTGHAHWSWSGAVAAR